MAADGSAAVTRREASDLLAGLRARPRSIPSRYFYDETGSALFDAICDLPEYYLTRSEEALLVNFAPEIAQRTGARELVELGSGTARKTTILIEALLAGRRDLRYTPLDISEYALESAAARVRERFPRVEVRGVVCDYTKSLDALDPGPDCLAAFLGSTIGNFGHDAGVELLRRLRERLAPGDFFLLGADLVKDAAVLDAAYNDAAGITARFNKNILLAVNREVAGDFDPEAFGHLAFFDRQASQIEMHLVSRRRQQVRLRAVDLELTIDEGERIRTEISRKFTRESAERLLQEAGFTPFRWFTPEDRFFALALARVAASTEEATGR